MRLLGLCSFISLFCFCVVGSKFFLLAAITNQGSVWAQHWLCSEHMRQTFARSRLCLVVLWFQRMWNLGNSLSSLFSCAIRSVFRSGAVHSLGYVCSGITCGYHLQEPGCVSCSVLQMKSSLRLRLPSFLYCGVLSLKSFVLNFDYVVVQVLNECVHNLVSPASIGLHRWHPFLCCYVAIAHTASHCSHWWAVHPGLSGSLLAADSQPPNHAYGSQLRMAGLKIQVNMVHQCMIFMLTTANGS